MTLSRNIRILCSGDLHLGRYPTRVPIGREEFTVAHVWRRMVDYAIDQKMDAVALTGDVVDLENKFFESYGPLRKGLERLGEAGISTYAVSGNHDYDVLPSLHDALGDSSFHLVGRGGRWETVPLAIDGRTVMNFCGWSFPKSHVSRSPLEDFELKTDEPDLPVVGLLHGDLGQPDSGYAPVSLVELNARPVSAWLLGHIHKAARYPHRDGFVLYPGSLQPLRTGERGPHGPWVVEISPSGTVDCSRIPLATLAYLECEINLEGVVHESDFRETVIQSVRTRTAELSRDYPDLVSIVYTIILEGRTVLHGRIQRLVRETYQEIPASGLTVRIVSSSIETRPDLDLESLSKSHDPVGVAARLVQKIDAKDDLGAGPNDLIREIRRKASELQRKVAYSPLLEAPPSYDVHDAPDDEEVRRLVRDQALRLIEEMLQQKSDGSP